MQQKLAHYQIEDLLGEGSFAWVYRAHDQKFEQDVALKLLKPIWMSDPQAVARFKQEARTVHNLRHPHIVDVYDVGEAEGQVYLAQRLVEGETLADRLARGPMAWDEMLKIVTSIASALDYAHNEGIIHRDLKPANILLGPDNKAILGDFGLVRAVEGSASLSASGSMVGTGHYMAPEIWDGKKATPATDVYALSCVVFEMLKGEVLFEGSSMMAVLKKHADGPKLPKAWPPGIPTQVNDVLKRGLAEDPTVRISSAGDLVTQLTALNIPTKPASPQPVAASTTPITSQPAKSRLSWLFIGGAIVIFVFIGAIAFFALSGDEGNVGGSAAAPTPNESPLAEPKRAAEPTIDTKATSTYEAEITELEEQLSSVSDDAQLANVDLQNILQQQEQLIQKLSNIHKQGLHDEQTHDEIMAAIRKLLSEIESKRVVKIQNQGKILIGVRENSLYPLTIVEGNNYSGFEIDLAQEIVRQLFGDKVAIEWVPVTAQERLEILNRGEIDFLVRNMTHTVSREELVMFTSNYLQDGARLLVRRGEGVNGVADLEGKTVSTVKNSVSGDGLSKAVNSAGIHIESLVFDDEYQAFNAFDEGRADVFVFDWTPLLAWSQGNNSYQIVGEVLSSEPLAIGTPPNEPAFRAEIDVALWLIIDNGTWQILYDRWFPEPHPWSIEEILNEPPANR